MVLENDRERYLSGKIANPPYHGIVAETRRRPYRPAAETRECVLETAARLFYLEGIRAVGVDRLAKEAGVTTTALYRLFGSKEGLIVAYLQRADTRWFQWLEETAGADGLPGVFDGLDQEAADPSYRGCPFRMALAEYPSPVSEIHHVAIDTKLRTMDALRDLAAAAGCKDPDTTAGELMIVMEGIWASAPERPPGSPAGRGPSLARQVLKSGR
jgi:AcrR family transcriptional regulator